MAAQLIDGVAHARAVRAALSTRARALAERGIAPRLAVVLAGDDPASRVYVAHKARACAQAGIGSELHEFPAEVAADELVARVRTLAADPAVHGILVQLPLPRGIDPAPVLEAVPPEKDVDGFHPLNLGALAAGRPRIVPCTPAGVVHLLEREGVPVTGRRAVVLGRSHIVGRPLALLLLARDATVTICHSRTEDLAAIARQADILVAAIGRPRFVTADMVKPGACVVDVGINRLPGGGLAGDVDFESVREVAGWITPVPGGVGPMTVAMLLANTLSAAERAVR